MAIRASNDPFALPFVEDGEAARPLDPPARPNRALSAAALLILLGGVAALGAIISVSYVGSV